MPKGSDVEVGAEVSAQMVEWFGASASSWKLLKVFGVTRIPFGGGVLSLASVVTDLIWTSAHTVKFEVVVASHFGGLLDQTCTTQGPKVNCVRHTDF